MLDQLQIIGSGGAFDTKKINSSFLFKAKENSLLYDCGYNVFSELKRLEDDDENIIKNINTIIISHDDDDHYGSVKSLIYYRYFILGLQTTIIAPVDVLSYLNKVNHEYKNNINTPSKIITMQPIEDNNMFLVLSDLFPVKTLFVKGMHHVESYGIIFSFSNVVVGISGDSKANSKFEKSLFSIASRIEGVEILLFQDFSYFDDPTRQVHACATDCKTEFSKEYRDLAISYHNAENSITGNVYNLNKDKIKYIGNETFLSDICQKEEDEK